MKGYKVFTHDLRSPIQGGEPVWDGSLPYRLPSVHVDRSPDPCGAGWAFCERASDALTIAGLWRDGRPARLFVVDSGIAKVETRDEKSRSSTLTIERECSENEVHDAVAEMSSVFGKHALRMTESQMSWRVALSRPLHDKASVEEGLRAALVARGLDWTLREYPSVQAAQDARAAWAARAARDAWAARDARDARAAWAAWPAQDARAAWAARAARDAETAWNAWNALDDRDAQATRAAWGTSGVRSALVVEYIALRRLVNYDPLRLTTGLRDAYRYGLEGVLPTASGELGYAMERGGKDD